MPTVLIRSLQYFGLEQGGHAHRAHAPNTPQGAHRAHMQNAQHPHCVFGTIAAHTPARGALGRRPDTPSATSVGEGRLRGGGGSGAAWPTQDPTVLIGSPHKEGTLSEDPDKGAG